MNPQAFINEWNGQYVPSRGGIQGQCVSLVQRWAEENGVSGSPIFPVPAAKDIPHCRDDAFTWVDNTPAGVPNPGDIVVFGSSYGGGYGHTGLFISGDTNTMTLFEENDPDGSPAHLKPYNYNDCLGWYQLKNGGVQPGADNQGVVQGDHVNVHTQPTVNSAVVGWHDDQEVVVIDSRTQGDTVNGKWGNTNWWYYIEASNGCPAGWISDGFTLTTHNPANVPDHVSQTPPPTPAGPTGRVMYDSTSASDIPLNAPVVGGYVDGKFKWSDADWARFPNATKVRIAVFPDTNDGEVLDVENGDATPEQAPGWVKLRRAAGINPTCYCNRGNLQAIKDAFNAASEPEPTYWVATLDGTKLELIGGVVACQYAGESLSGGHYDLSTVLDAWPSATAASPEAAPQSPAPSTQSPTPEQKSPTATPQLIKPNSYSIIALLKRLWQQIVAFFRGA